MVKHFGLMLALVSTSFTVVGCSSIPWLTSSQSSQDEPLEVHPATPTAAMSEARKLAWEAAVLVQNPPHPEATWQKARIKWRQAIQLLETIPPTAPNTAEAKQHLATYRTNYQAIHNRWLQEQKAQAAYRDSQAIAWQAAVMVQHPPHALALWERADQKWQAAIAKLEQIPPLTSVSAQAATKLVTYRQNQQAIQQQVALEQQALVALKQFSQAASYLEGLSTDELAANPVVDSVGIGYDNYLRLISSLKTELNRLAQYPKGAQHPVYQNLVDALTDYDFAVGIWQAYLAYKQENSQWLNGSAPFNQLLPLDRLDEVTLRQKYGIKTYVDGTKVSLKFTIWAIWQRASQVVSLAEKKVQVAELPQSESLQSMAWSQN